MSSSKKSPAIASEIVGRLMTLPDLLDAFDADPSLPALFTELAQDSRWFRPRTWMQSTGRSERRCKRSDVT